MYYPALNIACHSYLIQWICACIYQIIMALDISLQENEMFKDQSDLLIKKRFKNCWLNMASERNRLLVYFFKSSIALAI